MNKQKFNTTKMAIACGILVASISFSSSSFAFSDLSGDPAEVKINSLQASGVISGVTNEQFAPNSNVTYAQGLQFLVNAFDLKVNNNTSKASDHFAKVADNAWYSTAFVIAQQNGLSVDKLVNPNAAMTRIQFAHLLHQALMTKGNFPVTTMFFNISDGGKLSKELANSLQTLLNTRIIALKDDGKFRPNEAITRSEAAILIYNAREFALTIDPIKELTPSKPSYEAIVSIDKAADGVNKISLTIDNLPNPGYSIAITRIEFGNNLNATVYYRINNPDPNMMYPQVISKSTAITYLAANYKVMATYDDSSVGANDPLSLLLPIGKSPIAPIGNPQDLIAK